MTDAPARIAEGIVVLSLLWAVVVCLLAVFVTRPDR